MKYTKPMILIVNLAASAIQGIGKGNPLIFENAHLSETIPAYEADE